jgi:hypothetical protein
MKKISLTTYQKSRQDGAQKSSSEKSKEPLDFLSENRNSFQLICLRLLGAGFGTLNRFRVQVVKASSGQSLCLS